MNLTVATFRRHLTTLLRWKIFEVRQSARCGEGVNILDSLVPPNAFDTREAQGKSASVTRAFLDRIEGHLNDDLRLNLNPIAHP